MAEKTDIQTNEGGMATAVEAVAMNPEAANPDIAAMNPEAASAVVVNPETAPSPQPVAEIQAQQVNVMTAPVTVIQPAPTVVSTPPLPQGTAEPGKYEEFLLMPDAAWPPPIFIRKSVSAQERFYIENRWHSQWNYYDKKANESKKLYYRYQSIVVIGSVIVPVLVSFSSALGQLLDGVFIRFGGSAGAGRFFVDVLTVLTSTLVAIAAAVESLQKYGDGWSSYRSAAEELQAEKYFYDMLAGPYANNPNPFATFVERTEGVVANQNGKYFQAVQQQIQKQAAQNEELLERHKSGVDDNGDAPAAG